MTKTETGLIYPEPRLAVRPWADYGDENPGEDGRDPSRDRRDPGPGVSDGPLSSDGEETSPKIHPSSYPSRLPVPRFLCFECGAQFEDDPDPQYGDCPHCSHAGAVGLADSEDAQGEK